MKRNIGIALFAIVFAFSAVVVEAQQQRETYTGTVVSFGTGFSTRTVTRSFTLNINRLTSDEQAQSFLSVLREDGQDDLLELIGKENLGNFSLTGQLGRDVNVVRESVVDGKRRIFIVFERWLQSAELRVGARSVDYPFSVIEMFVDERTGKGEGTFIPAARISWDYDDKTKQHQVEIENFGAFPARLIGVTRRPNRPA